MGNPSSFSSSAGGAFIRSPGAARGQFAAGVKTIHAVVPFNGFGNVVASDGSLSFDPTIPWIFTKKTVSASWNHHLGDYYHSNTCADQQTAYFASLAAAGWIFYPTGDSWSGLPHWSHPAGESSGAAFVIDFSDPSYLVFPTPTAAYTHTSSTELDQQYWEWYDITAGPAVGQHYTSVGSADTSCDGADCANLFSGFGAYVDANNAFSHYAAGAIGGAYSGFLAFDNKWHHAKDVTGATITETWTGQRYYAVQGNGVYPFANFTYGTETFSMTVTTTYSVPVLISDLETQAKALLDKTCLTNSSEAYICIDSGVRLDWNLSSASLTVQRAEIISGITGSYSNISSSMTAGPFFDTTAAYGHTYSYRLAAGSFSSTASITVTAPTNPVLSTPFSFTPAGPASNPPTGLTASLTAVQLKWTTIANALNPNVAVILFPTNSSGGFAIGANPTTLAPTPFYLAARSMNWSTGYLGSGTHLVSSKSRGFLTGNSPNHSPPVTSAYQQKFYYSPASYLGSGSVDETAAFPALTFPHGRSGHYAWQLTKELPANKEAFLPSDVPAFGYLYYL